MLNALLILDPLIQALKANSIRVVLYGSYSTGAFTSESDCDLFIASEEKEIVESSIDRFKRKKDLDIRPIIMSLVEWMQMEKDDPVFFGEINRGITLWEKPIDERGF
ncbi:MAG: nucleotidyltransferase domain-containing protein [Acidobacteria bacterium]|nr:nucleotidyltransferase domain-containing protein [Acidobacteriota bacterium]